MFLYELTDTKKNLYACRHLKNGGDIIRWAEKQGFQTCLPENQFHITLAHSKELVQWIQPLENTIRLLGGKRKVQKLGDATVLRFNSNNLHERWQMFVDNVGCSWDFPSFIQHISISYDYQNINIKDIEPFDGDLIFGPEEFSELNSNFASKFSEIKL